MSKFTSGGWYLYESLSSKGLFIFSSAAGTSTTICRQVLEKADAHLISAAPDMYRALRGLLEAHRHAYGLDGAWDSEVKAAEKALAKADGE